MQPWHLRAAPTGSTLCPAPGSRSSCLQTSISVLSHSRLATGWLGGAGRGGDIRPPICGRPAHHALGPLVGISIPSVKPRARLQVQNTGPLGPELSANALPRDLDLSRAANDKQMFSLGATRDHPALVTGGGCSRAEFQE